MLNEPDALAIAAVDDVWVKLEGVLANNGDFPSRWAIGSPTPAAEEILKLASGIGRVFVYGEACLGTRGQRAVQRWVYSHGFGNMVYWVTPTSEPPKGTNVEVIDRWPMSIPSS